MSTATKGQGPGEITIIGHIVYDKNRLILNMNDDIQFGYLDLNGIVG